MSEEFAPVSAEPSPIVESSPIDGGTPETPPEPSGVSEAPTRSEAIERAFEAVDGERPRGPDGKFIAKETPEGEQGAEPVELVEPKEGEQAEKPASTIAEPPSRFSADAKEAWKDAPEAVRGEIQRAITELETGLAKKDEQLAPLQPYFEMAAKHGVTVDGTLKNYITMENNLRADLPKGMELLAANLGMTVEDMFAKAQGRESQSTDAQREVVMLKDTINGLQQKIDQLSQGVQSTQQDALMRQINEWAADKPRFSELEQDMVRMIETGFAADLDDAYQKAERLNPAPAPAQAAPPAPAQTRPARSVTGAPSGGSNPTGGPTSTTRTEAIERAMSRAGF